MRDRKTTLRSRALRQEQTTGERALWSALRAHRLNNWGFRRQSGVAGYVVDFVCLQLKLIVEVDGPHHEAPEQQAFDRQRDAELEALGFKILRIHESLARERTKEACAWIALVGRRLEQGLPMFPDESEQPWGSS